MFKFGKKENKKVARPETKNKARKSAKIIKKVVRPEENRAKKPPKTTKRVARPEEA